MEPIVIGVIVVVVLLLLGSGYWYFGSESTPAPAPAPATTATDAPVPAGPTYTTISAGTTETKTTQAMPGTTIITDASGQTMVQYGQETPVSMEETEAFQPYMSVLTNDMYRSDAAFDDPLGPPEMELHGNYYDW